LLAYASNLFPDLKRTVPALKHDIRYPSRDVITTALPLAIFQLAGHILSSIATSKIPISLVHTIKGLSPLFTVLAYRIFFRIRYASATYLSLIPLTLGVMLACSTDFSTNFFGILCALSAALVFVSQNIFSKKLFNEASRAESEPQPGARRKLDKLNLLCYCSGIAFVLTMPIWFVAEGYPLMTEFLRDGAVSLSSEQGALDHGALVLEFIFNGVSHFAQSILAFTLLSMISPVSYSVASLIKRVFVITVAIVWFGSSTTPVQAFGIGLTFLGLYLYDRNSHDDLADQRANSDHFRSKDTVLPLSVIVPNKTWDSNGYIFPTAKHAEERLPDSHPVNDEKKEEDGRSASRTWLPPGTKQESTWQPGDSPNPG
jgi:solute carrier family 35 protein E1